MKTTMKAAAAILAAALAATVFGDGRISLDKGATTTVDPKFQVEKFDAGKGDIVAVEVSGGLARVTGLNEGMCVLRLIGVGGNEATYEVKVGSDLKRIYRNLLLRLDGVTGIDITMQDDYLRIRGEVNDPEEWYQLKRVVGEDGFRNFVKDDSVFRIQADTRKKFYDELTSAGFKLVDNIADTDAGGLFIKDEHNAFTISGTVFAPERLARLNQIVQSQSWLRNADAGPVDEKDSWKPTYRINVTLDQRLLHMDVVLIGYEENDGYSYGTEDRPVITTVFNSFVDLIHGRAKNENFRIDADLNSTLDFLAEQKIVRHSIGGYLRFRSNDAQPNKLKIGGTLKVKMKSATAEGAPTENFEDINYGFTVDKKIANLVDAETVHIELDVKQENPVPMEDGGYQEGYNVEQYEYNPVIDCPLGKTVVIAGYRKMVETTIPPSGFPILRHIPIVNWFVSKEGNAIENLQLMMLVSVRAVRPDEPEAQEAKLPYAESKDLPKEVEITNEERLKAREEHDGFWSWLNWFVP